MTIPRELDEAALIDGASYPRILGQVILPLMKPVLATVVIIGFIGTWNDFMGPLIYLNDPLKLTVSVGLRWFDVSPSQTEGLPEHHLLMAACVMAAAPSMILFFVSQKVFVQGIVMSGIKG